MAHLRVERSAVCSIVGCEHGPRVDRDILELPYRPSTRNSLTVNVVLVGRIGFEVAAEFVEHSAEVASCVFVVGVSFNVNVPAVDADVTKRALACILYSVH